MSKTIEDLRREDQEQIEKNANEPGETGMYARLLLKINANTITDWLEEEMARDKKNGGDGLEVGMVYKCIGMLIANEVCVLFGVAQEIPPHTMAEVVMRGAIECIRQVLSGEVHVEAVIHDQKTGTTKETTLGDMADGKHPFDKSKMQ